MAFPLPRRPGPRARQGAGVVFATVGPAVVAVSGVVTGPLLHGAALTVIGAALSVGAVAGPRPGGWVTDVAGADGESSRGGPRAAGEEAPARPGPSAGRRAARAGSAARDRWERLSWGPAGTMVAVVKGAGG